MSKVNAVICLCYYCFYSYQRFESFLPPFFLHSFGTNWFLDLFYCVSQVLRGSRVYIPTSNYINVRMCWKYAHDNTRYCRRDNTITVDLLLMCKKTSRRFFPLPIECEAMKNGCTVYVWIENTCKRTWIHSTICGIHACALGWVSSSFARSHIISDFWGLCRGSLL